MLVPWAFGKALVVIVVMIVVMMGMGGMVMIVAVVVVVVMVVVVVVVVIVVVVTVVIAILMIVVAGSYTPLGKWLLQNWRVQRGRPTYQVGVNPPFTRPGPFIGPCLNLKPPPPPSLEITLKKGPPCRAD